MFINLFLTEREFGSLLGTHKEKINCENILRNIKKRWEKVKISPDGKMVSVSPADLLIGSLTFKIEKSLPLIVTSYKEKSGLVIEIKEE